MLLFLPSDTNVTNDVFLEVAHIVFAKDFEFTTLFKRTQERSNVLEVTDDDITLGVQGHHLGINTLEIRMVAVGNDPFTVQLAEVGKRCHECHHGLEELHDRICKTTQHIHSLG